jgi:hypothetical protein
VRGTNWNKCNTAVLAQEIYALAQHAAAAWYWVDLWSSRATWPNLYGNGLPPEAQCWPIKSI